MWTVYVFDMDGTIIDSMEDHGIIFSNILNEYASLQADKCIKYYHATAGWPLDEQFVGAVRYLANKQLPSINTKALVNDFWHRISKIIAKPFPNAAQTLKHLKKHGKYIAVMSGCTKAVVAAKLTSCDLMNYFDLTLGTDYSSSTMRKGTHHLDRIVDQSNIDKNRIREDVVLIGDAPHDIVIGKSYGIATIGILNKFNENDVTFLSSDFVVSDIIDILLCNHDNR